jgi:hypothetical protein
MKNVRKYSINYRVTEPDRPNHNAAEGVIREIWKKWFRIMVRKHVPKRLWDYGLCWVCKIQVCSSNTLRGHDGCSPLERLTGESVNISEYLDFGFFDWILYKDNGRWTRGNKTWSLAGSVPPRRNAYVVLDPDKGLPGFVKDHSAKGHEPRASTVGDD